MLTSPPKSAPGSSIAVGEKGPHILGVCVAQCGSGPEKGGLVPWNSLEWAPEGIQELGSWGVGAQLTLILQARARGGVLPSASFSQSIGIRGGTTFHSVELSHVAVQGHPGNLGTKCQ